MIQQITIERVRFSIDRAFDDVLAALNPGIGLSDLVRVEHDLAEAPTWADYTRVVEDAAGSAGLMQFLRLDLETALEANPELRAYRLVRIIAGNPVTMSRMTSRVPDAGSYAPVTILAFEDDGLTHLVYDTVASALAPYGDEAALAVARELDDEVLGLLRTVTA